MDVQQEDGGHVRAVMESCELHKLRISQRWVVDATGGFLRSALFHGHCIDVVGTPGWRNGAAVDVTPCDYVKDAGETDQRWKFDKGGFIVNRLSGKCLDVTGSGDSQDGVKLELWHCNFEKDVTDQSWEFVGMSEIATMHGLLAGRPSSALEAEDQRRTKALTSDSVMLLTVEDVQRSFGENVMPGGFWKVMRSLFENLVPSWRRWTQLFELWTQLGKAGPAQKALGTAYIFNMLSNMVFAGTNFVHGFQGPDLNVWSSCSLKLADFTGPLLNAFAWSEPVKGETLGLTSFQQYLNQEYGAKLPEHTFFDDLFTGQRTPSWEDSLGHNNSFALLDSGMAAARATGYEPVELLRDPSGARFAFDAEGLVPLFQAGFGWFSPREVKYASNGDYGVAVVESLVDKFKAEKDVLGLLMTDSVLSAHLSHNGEHFVADLTSLEKYTPLPGYAPLGGKALFEEKDGRLATVSLEYRGSRYTSFEDEISDLDYHKSTLSGWRFAEKAIIASLMAKTQLLMHVKTVHLELAPGLQAVTVDAFASNPRHPLRRLLEPFISRSVQASQSNIKLWFQHRAGEFALAPLPMEEQLKLIHDTMKDSPLNLADLDMERYAKDRGMEQFTLDGAATEPAAGAKRWVWRWHYRALKVQRLMEKLVNCWMQEHYGGPEGETAQLNADEDLLAWWRSMLIHVPALRASAFWSKDWMTSAVETTTLPPTTTEAIPTQRTDTTVSGVPFSVTAPPPAATSAEVAPLPGLTTAAPSPATATAAPALASTLPAVTTPQATSPPLATSPPATIPAAANPAAPLATAVPDSTMSMWRRRRLAAIPGLNAETLRNVLRTILVWVSWIHEDVGHSAASLIYNPVHAPSFVPEDGVGIPLAPLTLSVAAYRNFVFLERGKLLDEPPQSWFDQKECKRKLLFFHSCKEPTQDRVCFGTFQAAMRSLALEAAFSECDKTGFYSCLDRVETSASS